MLKKNGVFCGPEIFVRVSWVPIARPGRPAPYGTIHTKRLLRKRWCKVLLPGKENQMYPLRTRVNYVWGSFPQPGGGRGPVGYTGREACGGSGAGYPGPAFRSKSDFYQCSRRPYPIVLRKAPLLLPDLNASPMIQVDPFVCIPGPNVPQPGNQLPGYVLPGSRYGQRPAQAGKRSAHLPRGWVRGRGCLIQAGDRDDTAPHVSEVIGMCCAGA